MATFDLDGLAADAALFTFTKTTFGGGAHEYIVSSWGPIAAEFWWTMRQAIEVDGEDRTFRTHGGREQTWRYLDLPDGYTYWTMREWIRWPEGRRYDPGIGYVLNRRRT